MAPSFTIQVRHGYMTNSISSHLTYLLLFSSAVPPFDRHDWVVRRPQTGEEVRYVIDYYSAPPEPDGSPVFSLDVRPALDSFGSVKERIAVATNEVWANFKQDQKTDTSQRNS
jgi:hypothetical protein